MLRFEISEEDGAALPPIDVDDDAVVLGSGEAARIRLPAAVARAEHVRFERRIWTLCADVRVGGMARAAGDSGPVGRGTVFELGAYRVRVSAAPAGSEPASRQRTESLARELVRGLLGEGAAPSLEIERGPGAGTRRALPPPEATLVIGRGDEATWVIVDADLSRAHAEIRRGWDGVTVVDLGSRNGTRLDGRRLGGAPVLLGDGATLTLGKIVLRFSDPAERHLRGDAPAAPPERAHATPGPQAPVPAATPWSFYALAVIAGLALIALIWILAS